MSARYSTLDLLRGIAVLGLPTMNVIGFAMPIAAYLNPTAYGEGDLLNHFLFVFFNLFADQKFMGLFTLLFGAGVVLLAEKREAKGQKVGLGHYSRMFWLLVIGSLHYWYLWEGDVLTLYAMIGFLIYPIYKLPVRVIFSLSIIGFLYSAYLFHIPDLDEETWQSGSNIELLAFYSPSQAQIDEETAEKLGSYEEVMRSARSEFSEESADDEIIEGESDVIGRVGFALMIKTFGMMCLGMALYKSGFILGAWPLHRYLITMNVCLAVGLSLTIFSLAWNYIHEWSMTTYFSTGMVISAMGSVFTTLAYTAAFILVVQKNKQARWVTRVSKVGQMAMTNYLMQSVICAFIFYGYGLGLFGALSRLELLPIIVLIWLFQIYLSNAWLNHFTQGPMEWLWRTLSYYSFQPLRKNRARIDV